jgi:acyl-CoA reductase-like NAD-dependent aldehyde dehydrogenase
MTLLTKVPKLLSGSFGNLGEDAVDQFFPPTIPVNVNHTMKIMQEEVSSS